MTTHPSPESTRDDVQLSALHRAGVAAGAALALAVTWIHVVDQGGLLALKDPAYLGWGFRALELAALACAVLLLAGRHRLGWLLAAAVAAGPLLGITLSRSVGLPSAGEDIGNWGETIGVAAMVVEAALLVLAATALSTSSRTGAARPTALRTNPSASTASLPVPA